MTQKDDLERAIKQYRETVKRQHKANEAARKARKE